MDKTQRLEGFGVLHPKHISKRFVNKFLNRLERFFKYSSYSKSYIEVVRIILVPKRINNFQAQNNFKENYHFDIDTLRIVVKTIDNH